MELRDSYRRVGERIQGPCGDRESQEYQQSQLTLTIVNYQGLTTNQKVYSSWIMTYGTYVANVQLSLHVGPPICATGAIPIAVDCLWKPNTQLTSVEEVC